MLDIIMPSHNHLRCTLKAIECIKQNTEVPYRLLVMDDSDTYTDMYLSETLRNEQFIRYFHKAEPYKHTIDFWHEAFQLSEGDVIANVNNSAYVEPEWAGQALNIMLNDPKIAIMGFKIMQRNGVLIEQAGMTWNTHVQQLMNFGFGETGNRWSNIRRVDCVGWTIGLIRKSAFPNGLFLCRDYVPFRGYEDIDPCYEAQERGYYIVYCGVGGGCIHDTGATRLEDPKAGEYWENNRQIFISRWQTKLVAKETKQRELQNVSV